MTRLELDGISAAHGGHPILRGVSLSVGSGERFALLGASGSGKSTLLRVVAGLHPPTQGDVRLGGRSVLSVPPEARDVGLVFQDPLLFPHLSVAGNLAFGLRQRRVPRAETDARVADMLARTGLQGLGPRRVGALSGGQAGRAALGRALITRPPLLLLDEPLSALDAPLRRDLREWLVREAQERGTTLLLVTHDQEEALATAQRIGFLDGGRLAQVGEPAELYARPATLNAARFFGIRNFLPGVQDSADVMTALGRLRVARPGHGPVTVTVRPEAIRPGPAAVNTLRAQVRQVSFAGAFWRCELTVPAPDMEGPGMGGLGGQETGLVWHAPPDAPPRAGETVTLHLPPAACWTVPEHPEDRPGA